MRILVTDGAGFIDLHLCERLLPQGHNVLSLDNFFTGRREKDGSPGWSNQLQIEN